jgi:hypothetical protein
MRNVGKKKWVVRSCSFVCALSRSQIYMHILEKRQNSCKAILRKFSWSYVLTPEGLLRIRHVLGSVWHVDLHIDRGIQPACHYAGWVVRYYQTMNDVKVSLSVVRAVAVHQVIACLRIKNGKENGMELSTCYFRPLSLSCPGGFEEEDVLPGRHSNLVPPDCKL